MCNIERSHSVLCKQWTDGWMKASSEAIIKIYHSHYKHHYGLNEIETKWLATYGNTLFLPCCAPHNNFKFTTINKTTDDDFDGGGVHSSLYPIPPKMPWFDCLAVLRWNINIFVPHTHLFHSLAQPQMGQMLKC